MITSEQLHDLLVPEARFVEAQIDEDRVVFLFAVGLVTRHYLKVIIDPVDGVVRDPKLDVQVK